MLVLHVSLFLATMAYRGHGFAPDEELSDILTKLWNLDTNKCEPGEDYEVNLQGYVTNARSVGKDRARNNLFEWVSENVFERETYKAFKALLDNYESELGRPEQVTDEEKQENSDFLDLILATDVMKEAHSYLVDRGRAPADLEEFKDVLDNMWFRLIRRTRGDRDFDSSSFEHVFVGESRGKDVIGLHNWIQFYLQEKIGNIDYHGYFRRETLRDDEVPRLMALQFTWKEGEDDQEKGKPITSMFLGSSPEFEIAAYTLCRLLDKTDKFDIQLGEYEAQIVVYKMGRGIGTAYIGGAKV